MVRLARAEVFDPNEVAIAHVYKRTVRRCFLMVDGAVSGKNFDHRKAWIEEYLQQFAAAYVDLNPIRAAMAKMLEASDRTSVQRRIEALVSRNWWESHHPEYHAQEAFCP